MKIKSILKADIGEVSNIKIKSERLSPKLTISTPELETKLIEKRAILIKISDKEYIHIADLQNLTDILKVDLALKKGKAIPNAIVRENDRRVNKVGRQFIKAGTVEEIISFNKELKFYTKKKLHKIIGT